MYSQLVRVQSKSSGEIAHTAVPPTRALIRGLATLLEDDDRARTTP